MIKKTTKARDNEMCFTMMSISCFSYLIKSWRQTDYDLIMAGGWLITVACVFDAEVM